MKVLSLLQPWATLVVMGAKKIETRSWNTKYQGPLLIHASKRWDNKLYKTIIDIGAENILADSGFCLTNIKNGKVSTNLPLGAIIGKVNMVTTSILCPPYRDNVSPFGIYYQDKGAAFTEQELAFGDYSFGRWGWLLSDPIQFKTPTPAKGALSLWEFEEGLLID